MSKGRKSPLKDPPLRSAGQSVFESQFKLVQNRLLWPITSFMVLMILAAWEWQRYFSPSDPHPWLLTVLAGGAGVFFFYRAFSTRATLRRLKLGRDGERAVGEFLDRLRADGYQVFHDIVGDGFNVDHVLIGPAGVFTVETKTYSKPAKGPAEITFDGERIAIGNWEPDRNPVIQARAQSGWLKGLLKESTGKDFSVTPIIVFPGWFIKSDGRPARPIWVLNPKALPEYLKHQNPVLSESDVSLAAYHLSRFIRAEEARRDGN
jgi:hypothetical protein